MKIYDFNNEFVQDIPTKFWRRGYFSKVYLHKDDPSVVIKVTPDGVYDLEIYEQCSGPHIPVTDKLGFGHPEGVIYRQRRYLPLPAGHKDAKALRKAHREWYKEKHNGLDNGERLRELLEQAGCSPSLVDDTCELLGWAANYGNTYQWEVTRRNLAVDEKGNLILLDVVFDQARLRR